MRDLIVTENITLDGVIEATEGWFDPAGADAEIDQADVELVDEYRLFVYPVVLGRGERLFADATEVPRLRLVGTRPFRSGIVLLRYRTAERRRRLLGALDDAEVEARNLTSTSRTRSTGAAQPAWPSSRRPKR